MIKTSWVPGPRWQPSHYHFHSNDTVPEGLCPSQRENGLSRSHKACAGQKQEPSGLRGRPMRLGHVPRRQRARPSQRLPALSVLQGCDLCASFWKEGGGSNGEGEGELRSSPPPIRACSLLRSSQLPRELELGPGNQLPLLMTASTHRSRCPWDPTGALVTPTESSEC